MDALSRKDIQIFVVALYLVKTTFLDRMWEQALFDSIYVKLKQQMVDGVVRRYFLDRDLLYAKGNRLYVPSGGILRKELLRETHDS